MQRTYVNAVNSNEQHIEPMELDYARSPKHCHVCNQLGHFLASHCDLAFLAILTLFKLWTQL